MSMARPFRELRERMSPERQKQGEEAAQRELLKMRLAELRKNLAHLTQQDVADLLQKSQSQIAALEKRSDVLLSTLVQYVKVLGGELELHARFPDGAVVQVTQFENVTEQLERPRGRGRSKPTRRKGPAGRS
jgi:transcriptional regulator with XRE-family HTH domain